MSSMIEIKHLAEQLNDMITDNKDDSYETGDRLTIGYVDGLEAALEMIQDLLDKH